MGEAAFKDAARRLAPVGLRPILDRGSTQRRGYCRPEPENGASAQPENGKREETGRNHARKGLTHEGPLQKSIFRSLWFISGGGEVIGAFMRGEGANAGGDSAVELDERSGCGLAQQRLELGESILDRVELGGIGREE